MADDTDGQFMLTGDGGPRVAGPVHTETLRNIRLGSHNLQQFIHAVLDIPILVPFCTVSGMDNGQQIMGLRHMQAHYLLLGSYRDKPCKLE